MLQEEAAKNNGIALIRVDCQNEKERCEELLAGEIPGATVYFHMIPAKKEVSLDVCETALRTLLPVKGILRITSDKSSQTIEEKTTYVAEYGKPLKVVAEVNSYMLEIQWSLKKEDQEGLKNSALTFPVIQKYEDCSQYREDFKSKKSISRAMIDHHILPGFCMGSNESYGPDRVEKHAHPLLDQFFFSFEENDVELLIDDMVQPYEGNTLIHIPLGSNHGVQIPDRKKMHYVWIDFMVNPEAVVYLDEVHKKTGVIERFDESKKITK